jgi:hypothetical protein
MVILMEERREGRREDECLHTDEIHGGSEEVLELSTR